MLAAPFPTVNLGAHNPGSAPYLMHGNRKNAAALVGHGGGRGPRPCISGSAERGSSLPKQAAQPPTSARRRPAAKNAGTPIPTASGRRQGGRSGDPAGPRSGGARPSAALPLLNDTWHRHRHGALQLAPRRSNRDPAGSPDRPPPCGDPVSATNRFGRELPRSADPEMQGLPWLMGSRGVLRDQGKQCPRVDLALHVHH